MTDENAEIPNDEEIMEWVLEGAQYWIDIFGFGNTNNATSPSVEVLRSFSRHVLQRYFERLSEQILKIPALKQRVWRVFFERMKVVDLCDNDLSVSRSIATEEIYDKKSGQSKLMFYPQRQPMLQEKAYRSYEQVKSHWNPKQNPRLGYWGHVFSLVWRHSWLIGEHTFASPEQYKTYVLRQHQAFTALICDIASFSIEHLQPALLMIDEIGRDDDGGPFLNHLEWLFPIHQVLNKKRPESERQLHQFLSELEQKYPDLPIGIDLYQRDASANGQDILDLIHFANGYDSPKYQSFSLWQLLRKAAYYENQRSLDPDQIWSYALDLGVLVSRLIAIRLDRPLGMRILDEIQTGKIDTTHRLYREFYIYRHDNYLFAILRDSAAYFMGQEETLEGVSLDWRPESLAGYDYAQMELLHVPFKRSDGYSPGWHCSPHGELKFLSQKEQRL